MKLKLLAGSTSRTVRVFIQDSSSTTGAGLTGLVYNTSSLTAYYALEGATATVINLVTATAGTFTSSGFIALDATNFPGVYELGIPNAALTGAKSVLVMLKGATNMAPLLLEIELDAVNYQDGVHFGLTALPNAAAGANTGLPLGDASGRVDVGKVLGTAQTARDLGASVLLSPGTGTGQISITSGALTVGTNNDKTGYTASTVADKTGYALTAGEHTAIATDAQTGLTAQGYSSTRAGYLDTLNRLVQHAGTAQAGGLNGITLAVGASATNDLYKGTLLVIHSGTGAGQSRAITGYNGSNKVVTVDRAWATTPDATSQYIIMAAELPIVDANGAILAGAVLGNVNGSLLGHVVGYVGSVQGDVGGNVLGSVASVTAPVTADVNTWLGDTPNDLIAGRVDASAGAVADKSGYALTVAPATPANVTSAQSAIIAALPAAAPTAVAIRSEIDANSTRLIGINNSVLDVGNAVADLTIPSSADIATAVWAAVSRTLSAFGFDVTATVDVDAITAAIVAQLGDVGGNLATLNTEISDLLARIAVSDTILVTRTLIPGEPFEIYNGEAYPNGVAPAFVWIDKSGRYNAYAGYSADLVAYQNPSSPIVLSIVTITAIDPTTTRFSATSVNTTVTATLATGSWRYYVRINVSSSVKVVFSPALLEVIAP